MSPLDLQEGLIFVWAATRNLNLETRKKCFGKMKLVGFQEISRQENFGPGLRSLGSASEGLPYDKPRFGYCFTLQAASQLLQSEPSPRAFVCATDRRTDMIASRFPCLLDGFR